MAASRDLAIKRHWLRVVVLSVVSMGLYQAYWFYVTRRQLDAELGEERSLKTTPVLVQTLGPAVLFIISIPLVLLLIGIFGMIAAVIWGVAVWWYLIYDLNRLRERHKLDVQSPWLYVFGYAAASMISPAQLAVLGYLAHQLNEYWDVTTKGKATDAPYTGGEIAVSVVGLVLLVLVFILMILAAIFTEA